jgi:hypothetical protein
VDPDRPDEPLVAFLATKGDQTFSWDVSPTLAASLCTYFESEGWEVSLSIGGGPRRRLLPRIVRGDIQR